MIPLHLCLLRVPRQFETKKSATVLPIPPLAFLLSLAFVLGRMLLVLYGPWPPSKKESRCCGSITILLCFRAILVITVLHYDPITALSPIQKM